MPLKTLALLNPRKRRKARRSAAKTTTRRKTRRHTAKRRSTAVVHRRRRSAPVARRRKVSRRRRSGGSNFRARKITVLTNPRRRRSHRRARCNPFGGSAKGILGQVTGVFSKDNLAILAGGIGASVVVAQVTGRFGDKLPFYRKTDGTQSPAGIVLYDLGLPIIAAMLARKYAPNVAKGIIFGGLFKAATDALQLFAPTTYVQLYSPAAATSPASMYLGPAGGDSARATLGLNTFGAASPGYMASNVFRGVRPTNGVGGALDNSPAFARDAFAVRASFN